ncbi:MAG: ThuA domain-containing protein [Owenweeksia sp.]|nr:ThuA domain-containing protein [Owenweeksia sp.]
MKLFLHAALTLALLITMPGYGQNFKVLHYSETSGFDHQTRQSSLAMLQNLGQQHGFSVVDDQTGAAFHSLSNLQQFAVIIFANTSGDQILDSAQRANFESYIQQGGSLIGIHAASDTYRHSTANGSNTGMWDFYAEILGGSVQQNPNHTSANFNGTMDIIGIHPTTTQLPNPWNKTDEYYYWQDGYLNSANQTVVRLRSTGNQGYDTARPISWYKEMFTGARLFYTALGHANSSYNSDTVFQNHISDALLWAAGHDISLSEHKADKPYTVFPNPGKNYIKINGHQSSTPF